MAKYRKMDLSKLYEFKRRRGYLKSHDGRYLDMDKNGHYYLSDFGRKFRGKRIKPIRCRKEDACYFHIDAGDSIHLVAFGIIYVTKDGQHWVAVSGNGDGDGDFEDEDEDEDEDDDDDEEEDDEDEDDEDEEEQSDNKKVMITPPLVATIPKTKPAGHEITENHEIRDHWRAQITKETVRAMFAYMDKNPSFFEEWRDDKYMLENTGGEKITLIDEVWFLMVVDIETEGEGEGEGEEGAALYDIDGSSSDDEEMEVWACDLARSDEEELEMKEAAVDSGSQSELSDDEQVEPSTNIKTEMEGAAVDAGSLGKSYEQLEPSTNIKTEMEGAAVDDGSLGKSDEQSEPCTDIKMEMEGAAVDAGSLSKSDEPLEPNTNIKTEMRTKMEGAAVDAEGLKKGNKRKCM